MEYLTVIKSRLLHVLLVVLISAVSFLLTTHPAQASIDVSACADTIPQEPVSRACMAVMESFPAPAVLPIREDRVSLNTYSFWRVTAQAPDIFAAPGGGVTRQMGTGYNFVNVVNTQENWVQLESGEWMQEADVQYRSASTFTGVQILDGLQNRFAWVLGTLVTSPYPGAQQNLETGRVIYRYGLVNIFAEAYDENGWRWYMVGPDEWIEQRVVAKAFLIEKPEGVSGRWVAIDLYEQTLVAYEDETPVFATVIATGLPGNETNEGLFEVWAALDRDRMSGFAGAPTAYNLESVPWVMYFDDSISLHGTYWHDDFGYRRSRGCVNLSISDARFVFEWFRDTPIDTETGEPAPNYVYVHSSGEYRATGAATK